VIRMEIPEFTCLCPKTGQPDFATLHLEYVPTRVRGAEEPEALRLVVPQRGKFHEAVTNEILDDLVAATRPRFMRLTAEFYVRAASTHPSRPTTARRGGKAPERWISESGGG